MGIKYTWVDNTSWENTW